ncbi:hypothetical protein Rleg4DRAFT_1703 [Rhizobium leguminosarum bv. trifolii WSM2297]|uniref:Uncharacterized protein n=1 Tax=Rhizobium leguminosarum bv. trifolii WSM2297 TaxID=754762 RepID=J0KRA4_RHILT|nr:hypothetical protein Rleg4DRAFT_1703 [Rhizobium leguminosarum bv. trifolii WSM2297]
MKAPVIKPYRCVCTECDPLPPIEGLHPSTHEGATETQRKARGLLGIIAERVMPRRQE